MSSSTRQKLPRKVKKDVDYGGASIWIPGVPSTDPEHKLIDRLNQQWFKSEPFGDSDEIVVHLLLGPKSHNRWNDIIPERSSTSDEMPVCLRPEFKPQIKEAYKHARILTHWPDGYEVERMEREGTEIAVKLFDYDFMQPKTPLRLEAVTQ